MWPFKVEGKRGGVVPPPDAVFEVEGEGGGVAPPQTAILR